ncbi:MAG: hypothetical protein HY293_06920, partial [Planctomycetes bacterium]|nr:hypothetical protein [Planctomycetota bacterium]
MNSSFRIGLLAGLIAGAFATLVVTAILRPRPEPAPPPPPASSALVEVSAALKEENRVLREKVAELEKAKAAPPRKEEKPEAEKPAGPELKERFAKMIEAEGKSGFPEALAALKASGKPAIEFL